MCLIFRVPILIFIVFVLSLFKMIGKYNIMLSILDINCVNGMHTILSLILKLKYNNCHLTIINFINVYQYKYLIN